MVVVRLVVTPFAVMFVIGCILGVAEVVRKKAAEENSWRNRSETGQTAAGKDCCGGYNLHIEVLYIYLFFMSTNPYKTENQQDAVEFSPMLASSALGILFTIPAHGMGLGPLRKVTPCSSRGIKMTKCWDPRTRAGAPSPLSLQAIHFAAHNVQWPIAKKSSLRLTC